MANQEMIHTTEREAHTVTIKHDPESHEIEDCHDDCEATINCPGVLDSCRAWWECQQCRDEAETLSGEALDDREERLYDEEEAHGVEHQRIDGRWMTPTDRCIGIEFETDANDLVWSLPDGTFPVDLECDEGFVYVHLIRGIRDGGSDD